MHHETSRARRVASSLPHFRCVGLRNRCRETFPLVSVLRLARFSVNSSLSPRPSDCLLKAPRGRPPISVVFSPCAGYAPRFWCLAVVQLSFLQNVFALPLAVPFGHAVFNILRALLSLFSCVWWSVWKRIINAAVTVHESHTSSAL